MGLKRSVPPFDPASRLLEISLSRASLRRLSRASTACKRKKRGAVGRDCAQAPMKEARRPATPGAFGSLRRIVQSRRARQARGAWVLETPGAPGVFLDAGAGGGWL